MFPNINQLQIVLGSMPKIIFCTIFYLFPIEKGDKRVMYIYLTNVQVQCMVKLHKAREISKKFLKKKSYILKKAQEKGLFPQFFLKKRCVFVCFIRILNDNFW
jgi:hypothetical protein